jgi:hypothetical protein
MKTLSPLFSGLMSFWSKDLPSADFACAALFTSNPVVTVFLTEKNERMRNLTLLLIGALAIFLATSSCKNDEQLPTAIEANHLLKGSQHEGTIKLGKKLENPYSVKNMKKAYEKLKKDGGLKSSLIHEDSIITSHLYVRFLPQDSLENNALLLDPALELYSYPLDYEMVESGSYYHDPDIPEGHPTWLYTTVPINYAFPEVSYEILAECYIPDHDASLKGANAALPMADLEYAAYCITGNEGQVSNIQTIINSGGSASTALIAPSGTMRVWQSTAQLYSDGIKKVRVRANSFVKIATGWTDTTGYYTVDKSFLSDLVHYSLVYINSNGFKIWGNYAFFAPALYGMNRQASSGYSVTIGTNSVAWLWSIINNAACDYYDYCSNFQIPGPPFDLRIWNMRIGGQWAGSAPMAHHISLNLNTLMDFLVLSYAGIGYQGWSIAISLCMPDVFILKDESYTDRRGVYETVFHELAHTSHYQQVGDSFWRNYVLHVVLNQGYGDGSEALAGYCGVGEMWGNFFGANCGRHKFGSLWNFNYLEAYYNPGFLMKLHDEEQFSEQQLFSCLTSDINTINKLHDELIRQYPTKAAAIESWFSLYFPL